MIKNKASQFFITHEIDEISTNLSLAIKRDNQELIRDFNQTMKKIGREDDLLQRTELLAHLNLLIMTKLFTMNKKQLSASLENKANV